MNKKSIALIIILIAIIGVYGAFYVGVTSVLMPQDLNQFKSELDSIPLSQISNNDINQMENAANTMVNSPLSYMSQSERTNMANQMRSGNNVPPGVLNQNFSEYAAFNYYKALAYTLTFRGDLSSKINNLSSNYADLNKLGTQMVSLNNKSADDFEKGDAQAYANDIKSTANLMKQYNIKMEELKNNLQNIVNELKN